MKDQRELNPENLPLVSTWETKRSPLILERDRAELEKIQDQGEATEEGLDPPLMTEEGNTIVADTEEEVEVEVTDI